MSEINAKMLDARIQGIKEMVKQLYGYNDAELAGILQIEQGTLRNKKSNHELYTLTVWQLAVLEKLSGERIRLVD